MSVGVKSNRNLPPSSDINYSDLTGSPCPKIPILTVVFSMDQVLLGHLPKIAMELSVEPYVVSGPESNPGLRLSNYPPVVELDRCFSEKFQNGLKHSICNLPKPTAY